MVDKKIFKHTLSLPVTDFPMQAGLSTKESWILKYWGKIKLAERQQSLGGDNFTLHDGPPYANGHIHIGTALNKILKDIILKYHRMFGKNAHYIPGWDCHGLPIEWSVEKLFLEENKSSNNIKKEISGFNFRKRCREFASKWVEVQSSEFQRLGVHGNWDNPYLTMDTKSEVAIIKEIHKFLMNDLLYSSDKTVMWSTSEQTSLAEAEVEYKDITSKSIYLGFPVVTDGFDSSLVDAKVVIWTTTPWTIPGNRAIAFNSKITYGVYQSSAGKLILAQSLLESFKADTCLDLTLIREIYPGDLSCNHPLSFVGSGYDFSVPVLKDDFVADDTGTGFVHIAPSHGEDDYKFAQKYQIDVPDIVDENGCYYPEIGIVGSKHIFDYQSQLIDLLKSTDLLFSQKDIVHSYPHSWRSKQKVIYRNTKQWFISLDKKGEDGLSLREKALKSVNEDIEFFPERGKNRLHSMIESRSDWLISRQRNWGVPIAIFVNKLTGEVLKDKDINDRICVLVGDLGIDAWFDLDNEAFLDGKYNPDDYEKVTDIVDVWFESGCTHSFVLQDNRHLNFPADLYLEGSDQHRGWFQSSLLESCGTVGVSPYKQLITHGFVLDKNGYKMSKSLGNTIAPQEIISQYGADILRLWVISSDFTQDICIGNDIIKSQIDVYRRIRNTFRYILSNINDFSDESVVEYSKLPNLEKWVLHQVAITHKNIIDNLNSYNLHQIHVLLHDFCNSILSSFYFDVRKFSLYCDNKLSNRRRSCQTVLKIIADFLFKWYAPILSFTSEEAWMHFIGDFKEGITWEDFVNSADLATNPHSGKSIHLERFGSIGQYWEYEQIDKIMDNFFKIREVANCAIEQFISSGHAKTKLDLSLDIYIRNEYQDVVNKFNLSELLMVSKCNIFYLDSDFVLPENAFRLSDKNDIAVVVSLANGLKCNRCLIVFSKDEIANLDETLCRVCNKIVG